jgi:hypothetical protein
VVQILDGVAALDRGAVTAAKIFSGHVRAVVNESTAARPEERRESVRFNIITMTLSRAYCFSQAGSESERGIWTRQMLVG